MNRTMWALGFVAVAAVVLLAGSDFVVFQATLITIYAVVALSQEWLFGRAGQVSLGAAALMAVGAYATALTSDKSAMPFPLPLLVSLVAGGLVGAVIALPGLRFRGLYLMLTTLALQFIVSFAAKKMQGLDHLSGYLVTIPAWLAEPRHLLLLCLGVLAAVMLLLDGLYRSAPGRAWSAVRQNEVAAAVMGVSTVKWKVLAFIGSSAICSLGGGLYAMSLGNVDFNSFSLNLGLTIVVIVFVGGLGRILGPIVGAVFIGYLPIILDDVTRLLPATSSIATWVTPREALLASAIYGLLLLLVLLFERDGIAGLLARAGRWTQRRASRRDRSARRSVIA